MRVPSPTEGRTRRPATGLAYLDAAVPDYSGLVNGLNRLGASLQTSAADKKAESDKLLRFKTAGDFTDFETQTTQKLFDLKKTVDPAEADAEGYLNSHYDNLQNEFLSKVDPTLQPEFAARTAETRNKFYLDNKKFAEDQRNAYYKTGIQDELNKGKVAVDEVPENLERQRAVAKARIAASGLSDIEKAAEAAKVDQQLETIVYGKKVQGKLHKTNELRSAIVAASRELGVSPQDLATVISYETAGTFSTDIRGGKNNKYIGLIQFGETEQAKYGAYQGQSPTEQMAAVVRYLKDRGFKPGMGILDLYSTINAGAPGKYGASDTAVGGAPGTVADKVNTQFGPHAAKAAQFLDGNFNIQDNIDDDPSLANVPYEDRIALRKDAETVVNREIAEQQSQAKAQQDARVNLWKNQAMDGTLGQQGLDDLYASGEIVDYSDRSAIQSIIDKRGEDTKWLRQGSEKLVQGSLWSFTDDDDKKRADALWGQGDSDERLSKMDPGAGSLLRDFAAQTTMLPPAAIDTLNGMLASPDAQRNLYAANVLSELKNGAGLAYNAQVPKATDDVVATWETLQNVLTPEELVSAMRPGLSVEQRQQKEGLDKIFNQIVSNPNDAQYPSFSKVLEAFDPGVFETEPVSLSYGPASAQMQAEYVALLRYNHVKANGNMAAAQALSIAQLQRLWGNTDVGGTRKLMAHPPEKFVPKVDDSHEWVGQQAISDFRIAPGQSFELVSDAQTEADIEAGKPVSYKVATQTDGVWTIQPKRFAPVVTPKMKADEEARFRVKVKIDDLHKLYKQYDNAKQMEELTGVPIPKEIDEQINELENAVKEDTKRLAPKQKQGPWPALNKPIGGRPNPSPEAGKANERIKGLLDDVKKTIVMPEIYNMPGWWVGDTFYSEVDRIPEDAAVQDSNGKGFIKRDGKLVPQ